MRSNERGGIFRSKRHPERRKREKCCAGRSTKSVD